MSANQGTLIIALQRGLVGAAALWPCYGNAATAEPRTWPVVVTWLLGLVIGVCAGGFWQRASIRKQQSEMVIALRQAMQEGDFAVRLRLADHASLPQLAEIFNELMATMDIQDRVWQRDRRLWQATLDAAPVAIWVKDLAGRYVLVNQRAKISLGESCLGQTDSELMSAELSASERQDDRNVLLGQPRLPDVVKRSIKFAVLDAEGQPMAVCGVEGDFEDGRVG